MGDGSVACEEASTLCRGLWLDKDKTKPKEQKRRRKGIGKKKPRSA
jgi:hypothetical protein